MASYFKHFFILILNILKDLKTLSLVSLPVNFCSVTMASRRSKDKSLATDKPLVKKEHVSSLEIVSRFTPLGTILKPNYSSVLASSYGPYALTQPVKTVYPKASSASQYVKTQSVQNLFLLSLIGLLLLTLLGLLLAIFPHNFIVSLSIVRRMCNTILTSYVMRIPSLLKP